MTAEQVVAEALLTVPDAYYYRHEYGAKVIVAALRRAGWGPLRDPTHAVAEGRECRCGSDGCCCGGCTTTGECPGCVEDLHADAQHRAFDRRIEELLAQPKIVAALRRAGWGPLRDPTPTMVEAGAQAGREAYDFYNPLWPMIVEHVFRAAADAQEEKDG